MKRKANNKPSGITSLKRVSIMNILMTILTLVLTVGVNGSNEEKVEKANFITHLVFLDLEVDGEYLGRIELGLFGKVAPKAAENFAALADGTAGIGKNGKPLHYKGNVFHRIIPGMLAQAGDIIYENGTGGESIYGQYF